MEPIAQKPSITPENIIKKPAEKAKTENSNMAKNYGLKFQDGLNKIPVTPVDIKPLQKIENEKKIEDTIKKLPESDLQRLQDLKFQMEYKETPTITAVTALSSIAAIASLTTLAFPQVIIPLIAIPIGFGIYAYLTYKTHQLEVNSKLPPPTSPTTTGESASESAKAA